MEDQIANVQVFETTDYGKFTRIDGNRNLRKSHVNYLKVSFAKKNLGIPVIVNEKFEIIDGQHRIEALKELELPVLYIIKKGFGLKEVHVTNTNNWNWGIGQFMNSYADLGKEDYVTYREYHNKYRFGHRECIIMLSNGVFKAETGGNLFIPFKEGEFVIVDYDKGVDYADRIEMVSELYMGYRKSPFVLTMLRLFAYPAYNHTEFITKLRQRREMLYDASKINTYLRIIEDIYNYRRMDKVPFYQDLKTTR